MNQNVVDLLVMRCGGLCEYCGAQLERHRSSIHHRVPRGMGGNKAAWINEPANLLYLCGSGTTGCHGFFESHRELAMQHGVIVSRWNPEPWNVPFYDKRGRGWLLSDNGSKQRHHPTTKIPVYPSGKLPL